MEPDGTFKRFMHDPKNPNGLANNKVRAIFEDSRGIFWIGTAGSDGLYTLDREKNIFTRYLYNPAKPEELSRPPLKNEYDPITFIREDGSGAIWIGTNIFRNQSLRYGIPGKSHTLNPVMVIPILVVLRPIHPATEFCGWVPMKRHLFYIAWIHP